MPSRIQEEEFAVLQSIAEEMQHSKWDVVKEWYALDENARPRERVLLPISSKILDYTNNVCDCSYESFMNC
jgi:hypothetical protein